MNERSPTHRAPFRKRFLSSGTLIHLMCIIGASVILILRAEDFFATGRLSPFPGAVLRLAERILMISTPLWYMAFPPTVPERADLLVRGEDGLMRPRPRDEKADSARNMVSLVMWDVLVALLCTS